VQALAEVAAAVAASAGVAAPVKAEATDAARAVAESLLSGQNKAVLLGNAAAQHPQASTLLKLANWIAENTGAKVGYLTEAANTVGAQLVGALPKQGGLHAGQMLSQPMKALLLLNTEPVWDAADAAAATAALEASGLVVVLSAFKDVAVPNADVLLPIAPFAETAGSFVNAEGRLQSFYGVVKPVGETRPAWKVLRVLGNLLGLDGFNQESAEEVRAEAVGDGSGIAAKLSNRSSAQLPGSFAAATPGLFERIADVPIYGSDMLVRRSGPLQLTADARPPVVGLPSALWQALGLAEGQRVRVTQGKASAELPAREDATLAPNAVRVSAAHPDTATLGALFGAITVQKI
jgi:NADH-quinone oxidoreductase subunit G